MQSVAHLFWPKVDKAGPRIKGMRSRCWVWVRALDKDGYGKLQRHMAHRVSYELNVGPIPDRWQVDHLCANRRCVRPTHLEAVTQAENNRRRLERRGILCPAGHKKVGLNVYHDPRGKIGCRACRTAQTKAFYERKRAAA